MPTVDDYPFEDYPTILMTWEKQVEADIRAVFRKITAMLNEASSPLYTVVDLRDNPRFPLVDTVLEALHGPYRHENVREWLVMGRSWESRWIGDYLTRVTVRNNIRWFNSEEEVRTHLDQH